jgi:ubiquinone/menaquinone biosynthesis C-methylase UbiE
MRAAADTAEALTVNTVFHDHECAYYDERFAIVHDARSARQARREVEQLLGRRLRDREVVCDVGCGTGWLAAGLRRCGLRRVIGVDLSAGMLGKARAAGAWPLLRAEGGRLPLADATVDVVVGRGVLHHLPDVEAGLAEWRRVLRPGGAVVLSSEPTPVVDRHGEVLVRGLLALLRRSLTADEDFWEVASMAANLHVFTPQRVARLARAVGLRPERVDSASSAGTLVLTASYVTHGRRPALARRLPWREIESAGRDVDAALLDRIVPPRLRHTVVAVLRA